jgi:meso-butanediol dehydrogenase / (S,S)-butanediol dehydrogenase / diacetyl reductase
MGFLDSKVAIVTGAGQGVGRGIALAFAAEGAAIAVAGRTAEKLDDTCAEIERRSGRATPIECDVGELAQIEACVAVTLEHFGRVDILVNNAQAVPLGPLLKVPDEAFELGWRTGPLAAVRFMRACHPHLKGGGAIVNLASGAGLRPDPVGLGLYAAVKEAIRSITRAAACEWGADGIRVNAIIPLANSPGMDAWTKIYPQEAARFLATVPLGRVGDCERDIGRAVAMLVGPAFAYVTGTTLMLDGGQAYLR